MSEVLIKQVEEYIKNSVTDVLIGETEEFSSEYMNLNKVIDIVQKLGGTHEDALDTNGWEWDYWDYVRFDGKRYCISGSGYSGNCSISLSDEQDED